MYITLSNDPIAKSPLILNYSHAVNDISTEFDLERDFSCYYTIKTQEQKYHSYPTHRNIVRHQIF